MYSYLSLGDSYTIGEGLSITESFPYLLVKELRRAGIPFFAPEIIAKTGWTTSELQAAINAFTFLPSYDWVSLLIGVNNQYRGMDAGEYATEFGSLLEQAIGFCRQGADGVFVLSIPDWGVTPFAMGRDTEMIANEIDEFNAINRRISIEKKVQYIDITPGTRLAAHDPRLLAADRLHPSGLEYGRWAKLIFELIISRLRQ